MGVALAAGELVVGAAIGMLVVEDWALGEVCTCTDSDAEEDAAPNEVVLDESASLILDVA